MRSQWKPDARIRGRKLQEIRKQHFNRNPLCVMCEAKGRWVVATQLDHIIALVNGGDDIESNRQGLCDECHKAKTAEDMGYTKRTTIGRDGWPTAG